MIEYLTGIDDPRLKRVGGPAGNAQTLSGTDADGDYVEFRVDSGSQGNRKLHAVYPGRPDDLPGGLVQRMRFKVTQKTIDALAQGQIKLILNRSKGDDNRTGWLSIGCGPQFPKCSQAIGAQIDRGTGPQLFTNPVPLIAEHVHEIVTWYRREGDVPTADVWCDGQHVVQGFQDPPDALNPDGRLGSTGSTDRPPATVDAIEVRAGLEWTQGTLNVGAPLSVKVYEFRAGDRDLLTGEVVEPVHPPVEDPVIAPEPVPGELLEAAPAALSDADVQRIAVAILDEVLRRLTPG